jgi:hypothetical protein
VPSVALVAKEGKNSGICFSADYADVRGSILAC